MSVKPQSSRRGAVRKAPLAQTAASRWSGFSAQNLLGGLRYLGFAGVFAVLALLLINLSPTVASRLTLPISEIQFHGYSGGEFAGQNDEGVSEEELLEIALPFLGNSYWDISVAALRQAVEEHPWVRRATVSKRWPEKVMVGIDEYVPVARWNQDRLLSMDGRLLQLPSTETFADLPLFSVPWALTPSADLVRQMVEEYNSAQQMLGQLAVQINELHLSTTDNLRLQSSDGMMIYLGTHSHIERLQRLVDFVDAMGAAELDSIRSVDLRYPSGLSVQRYMTVDELEAAATDDELINQSLIGQLNSVGVRIGQSRSGIEQLEMMNG